MKSKRTVAAAAAALAICLCVPLGCSVRQPPPPPVNDLPAAYARTGGQSRAASWWRAFDDAQLDALITEALGASPDLAVWWDRLDQARALARQAGAGQWPQTDLRASATRSAHWPEAGSDVYGNEFGVGLYASYEVDLWGRVRANRAAARHDVQASALNLRAAALSLSAQVARVWYELAEARAQIDLLDRQLAANEQMLELVTLRFQRGQVGASDVLQQEQLVESIRGQRALAAARRERLGQQLAVLLGRTPERAPAAEAARLASPPPLPATGVPADLLRQRPDLEAAWARVAAAHARLASAIAERYPRLSLTASGQTGGVETADLFSDWLGNLAANLLAPLLDGGSRAAEAARREAAAREALHAYRATLLTALQEVEGALASDARHAEYVGHLRRQVELATTVLARTEDDYRGGQADYLRVLQAQTSLQTLQRQLLTAQREAIQYRIDLNRALGGDIQLQRPGVADAGGHVGEEGSSR